MDVQDLRSLMGDIFNHHPSIFYLHEPLQTVERIFKRLLKSVINTSHRSLAEEWLDGIFRCKFENPQFLADIEEYYRKQKHLRVSQAIVSPPLFPFKPTDTRWDPHLCRLMTSESLGSTCGDNYDLTVLKILISRRLPKNTIETILTSCSSVDVDCKIVFLVRDPRAVIPSSQSFGFFKENGDFAQRGIRVYSYWRCKETEDNLEIIRKLSDSIRNRIKLQRYEDLAFYPLKALSGLLRVCWFTCTVCGPVSGHKRRKQVFRTSESLQSAEINTENSFSIQETDVKLTAA